MKLKNLKIISILVLGLFTATLLQGCVAKDKEIVISHDVAHDIKVEESQVDALLKEGESYLTNNNFAEAKKSFEAAINTSVSDKEIYVKIKDQYLQAKRYDDAYYFINLAIKNNVDTENMNKILVDIRNNMDTVKITCDAYTNEVDFALPEQVKLTIDGIEYTDYVVWSDWNKDINNAGTYTYNGITKEYGRNVQAELKVEDFTENAMGFIRDTYVKDNETYIVFDEVEFYTGQEAITEGKKDLELPKDDNGKEFMPNGYYLRNSVEDTVTFKLSKEPTIKMCAFWIDPKDESTLPKVTDYETFKAHVDKYKSDKIAERSLLFKLDVEHGLGTTLEMQFTP